MGAKVALFIGAHLLVLQRDDKPGLLWPGYWDLPGGGREGAETPLETAQRETQEEFGLTLAPNAFHWARASTNSIGRAVWFFVGALPEQTRGAVRFGDEGQGWDLFGVDHFMSHDKVVPQFKNRLADYLRGVPPDPLFRKGPPPS
ncbi:NUDIX domain-containing protein [Aliishimia ponticola]|uniref:NUDIX domain-containing protein n=2 Tax=Aliishimia ponticola TaxID=2499833 RepID=A0A4S4N6X0_9RHOB|nr:NUDIX domain-containing protein [Aliishimia ponticola]